MKQVISLAILTTGGIDAIMENNRNNRHSDHHNSYKRERKIVDDPSSHYPLLLRWLRRNLKLMRPINNPNYIPILPTAA